MAAWKCSTRIDCSCCGGIFTWRFVSLLIRKYSRTKDNCWQNSFEIWILNHFLRMWKSTITTSPTSRQLATSYKILVARTEFLVALATRKAQFRTLYFFACSCIRFVLVSNSAISTSPWQLWTPSPFSWVEQSCQNGQAAARQVSSSEIRRIVLLMECVQISSCDFICEREESWC